MFGSIITLITCHFHPPGTYLIPSSEDFKHLWNYTLAQKSSDVRILDILALAKKERSIELLLLQQTEPDVLQGAERYIGRPLILRSPPYVFDSFRSRVLEKTFSRFFPGQPTVIESLLDGCDGLTHQEALRMGRTLPSTYALILAEELERSGLYKAGYYKFQDGKLESLNLS